MICQPPEDRRLAVQGPAPARLSALSAAPIHRILLSWRFARASPHSWAGAKMVSMLLFTFACVLGLAGRPFGRAGLGYPARLRRLGRSSSIPARPGHREYLANTWPIWLVRSASPHRPAWPSSSIQSLAVARLGLGHLCASWLHGRRRVPEGWRQEARARISAAVRAAELRAHAWRWAVRLS